MATEEPVRQTKKPKLSGEESKLEELWTSVKCKELLTQPKVITIGATDKLSKACETLAEHGVSSAPVWSEEDKRLCGMFDFRDLGAVLIKAFDKEHKKLSTFKDVLSEHSAELATDLSGHDKFYSVSPDSSLLDAVDFFGAGVHRVVVLDGTEKKLVGILSQSDALSYFNKKLTSGDLDWLKNKTLDELKLWHKGVVSIDESATVLEGLKLMHSKGLSSIAIIDSEKRGTITANMSMSDIKYLVQQGKLDSLKLPLKTFIQEVRLAKDRESDFKTSLPVFVITKDTTLQTAVGKLVATRTHRLWIVKGLLNHEVLGVVSLSDILRGLTPAHSQHRWKHQPYISFVPAP